MHVADQCHRSAKPKGAETQHVKDHLAEGVTRRGYRGGVHERLPAFVFFVLDAKCA